MLPDPGGVDLDLLFDPQLPASRAPGAPARFAPQLAASELTFARVDEHVDDGGNTTVRSTATIASGTLYLEPSMAGPGRCVPARPSGSRPCVE